MNPKVFTMLLFAVSAVTYGQNALPDSLDMLFSTQLRLFPQEKVYLHTDKTYYVAGETIWFRAHLADAANHVPASVSRYVYAELIDPIDSVLVRVKIRPDQDAYHGHILIPDDIPEGSYELRSYTSFMCSTGEDYLFTKQIQIGHPQSRSVFVESKFAFESEKKVKAEFFFRNKEHAPLIPEQIMVTVNKDKQMLLKADDNGRAGVSFNLPAGSRHRTVLLESVQEKHRYRQYITVPVPGEDFDVSFYPEGGALLEGTVGKVAFKALRPDGVPETLSGTLFDNENGKLSDFRTIHQGMGYFICLPEKGKTYYVIVKNERGQSKRYELPPAQNNGYALTCRWNKDKLFVAIKKPAMVQQRDTLYVVAHTRGIVQLVAQWEPGREFAYFPKEQFPSGVLHILLIDHARRPLSERLVFVDNNDQAQSEFHSDQENYARRSLVNIRIKLTDQENNPLTGNFSAAVTDDREVRPDTTTNILTSLLLTSDLRGKIENPAWYFKKGLQYAADLDLLMLTQGWRRYRVPEVLSGKFSRPSAYIEIGPEISGTVKTLFGEKPAGNIEVTALSLKGNYFETTLTDSLGRFYFRSAELPDSTQYIIHAVPKMKSKRLELTVNEDHFPKRTLPPLPPVQMPKDILINYGEKAEQNYTFEHGMRNIFLDEITVTASKKPAYKSDYYSEPDGRISQEQIERFHPSDIRLLLMQLPGVMVSGNRISIRGQGDPLLVVDGVTMDISNLDMVNVYDVAQVDVLKNASSTAVFGSQGGNGVIVIFTKQGEISFKPKPFNIQAILPLGYQSPVAFYAPKYDTPGSRDLSKPDLRTTIDWEPNVQADSTGVASFSFYTADYNSTYSVIIEGLTSGGKIIRQEGKIIRQKD